MRVVRHRQTHRVIRSLRIVKPVEHGPKNFPPLPTRGSRGGGIRYEKALAAALAAYDVDHNPWFYFEDANGPGYCQPDLILAQGVDLFVLEAKLTDCEAGRRQLKELYLPILRHLLGSRVYGITVSRYLTPESDPKSIVDSLEIAILNARSNQIPVLHWRDGQSL